jgi:hypothetical protein
VTARLRLLARIHVNGVSRSGSTGGHVWYLNAVEAKLRTDSVDRLVGYGDLIVEAREAVLSSGALAELEDDVNALFDERTARSTESAHQLRYIPYSRGRSRIKGLGISKGSEARCSCGWRKRSNGGRGLAVALAKDHMADELEKALSARPSAA